MSRSRSPGSSISPEAFTMRDLPSSIASSPFVGQSVKRQRMYQLGDRVGIGGPADQGRPLDRADFLSHLLEHQGVFLSRQLGPLGVRKLEDTSAMEQEVDLL